MTRLIFIVFITFILNNYSYASTKEKILEKFEKIDNLSFSFKQTIDGKDQRGDCIIKYPKKIYCLYKYRFKKILVSNGKSLVIKSEKNKQYYRYSLKSTPFNLLLDKNLLIKKIKELEGKKINEKYYNFLIKSENNTISIFFDVKNYNLIGWQTEDIYQNLTVTFIYDLILNEKVSEKLFKLPEMY